MRQLDITGQRFGRWTALYLAEKHKARAFWWCRCDCEAEKLIYVGSLRFGHTQSCGCLHNEQLAARSRTHGETIADKRSPEFIAYWNLRKRCLNSRAWNYGNYGARGIDVCREWLEGVDGLPGFEVFLLDMGRRPSPEYSIERIDNSRGYERDNCRWATRAEQTRNKRNNIWVRIGDKMMIITDAVAHIPNGRVRFSKYRKRYNLSPQDAYELVVKRALVDHGP